MARLRGGRDFRKQPGKSYEKYFNYFSPKVLTFVNLGVWCGIMSIETLAKDKSAQLAVKNAILARSGIYIYSRDEVIKMGIKPKLDKPFYREYRPAGVLIDAKDLFDLVPVPKDHPPEDITADNFHVYASGVTGGPVEAVSLPGGEVGLRGRMAFFTKDAYDYYMAGNNETSAGYTKKVSISADPERDGFDWVMTGITAVNHVAVLPQGRGGSNVRVLDKAPYVNTSFNGGTEMGTKAIGGFLSSLFGIGKAKDENFKFSKVLMDSVAKMGSLSAEGLDAEIGYVLAHVTCLGDSEAKDMLVGAVADCFKHSKEVLERKDEVAVKMDELYAKCRAEDAEAVSRILGDEEKEVVTSESKDSAGMEEAAKMAALVEASVQKAVGVSLASYTAGLDLNLEAKINAGIAKALGVDEKEKKSPVTDSRELESTAADAGIGEDASYLLKGIFGKN